MNKFFQTSVILPFTLLGLSACVAPTVQNNSPENNVLSDVSKTAFSKVSARFVPEREDDFAWENDKVAFRVYGPMSPAKGPISGVDAWFKSVDYPIIDKWYQQHLSGVSYHKDHGEGYDVYHTGTSRGVGGTAIWIDGEPYPAAAFNSPKVLQNTGQKVAFELSYEWSTPLGLVSEKKVVSLAVGDQLYKVRSQFLLDGKPAVLPIAIGLTTHNEAASVYSKPESGRISTWEIIDGKAVGTGALTNSQNVKEIVHTKSEVKDTSHIWLLTNSDSDGALEYSAGFAWSGAGEITTLQKWNTYLDALSN